MGQFSESPVVFVLGPLFDPESEGFLFLFGESIDGVERWHVLVLVGGGDALDENGFVRLARNDGIKLGGSRKGIEAEIGFAFLFVEAMTKETIVREDGTNVAVVADFLCRLNQGGQGQDDDEESSGHGRTAVLRWYRAKLVLSWMKF